jgi:hypothetical protein
MVKKTIQIILLLILKTNYVSSQQTFLDEINLTDNLRTKQIIKYDSVNIIQNSFFIRSTSDYQKYIPTSNKKLIKSYTFSYDFQNNTNTPQSFNDGIMYPSKGWQERYSIGVQFKWKLFDLNFQPEKLIVQNVEQEKYNGNTQDGNFMFKYFGMIANNIDNFRQFGYNKIDTTTLGQSRIGIKTSYLNLGFSNENIWWGPGKRNSLIFTNNAAGFKHIYLNNNKVIGSFLGNFEFSAITGILDTTKYYDIDQDLLNACIPCKVFKNLDTRKIDAISINFNPKIFPNLFIGYAYSRQYYLNETNSYSKNYSFYSKDRINQVLGSLMFRYIFSKDKGELYGEIGIPDNAPYPWKFFQEKSRTGLIFGLTKFYNLNFKNIYSYFNIEFTQLQLMDPRNIFYEGYPFAGGKANSWYLNTHIKQGYSNNGQLLGAQLGPGSNSQTLNIGLRNQIFILNFQLERIIYNNDFFYSVYFNPYSTNGYGYYNRYWVDMNSKISLNVNPQKYLQIALAFSNTNTMNYRWVRIEDGSLYDEPSRLSDKFNQQFQLSIKYLLHAVVK